MMEEQTCEVTTNDGEQRRPSALWTPAVVDEPGRRCALCHNIPFQAPLKAESELSRFLSDLTPLPGLEKVYARHKRVDLDPLPSDDPEGALAGHGWPRSHPC